MEGCAAARALYMLLRQRSGSERIRRRIVPHHVPHVLAAPVEALIRLRSEMNCFL